MERAGFTLVFDTGMVMRWIRVRARPMASPPKPATAFLAVAPRMMMRKNAVITTSATTTARKL